MSRSSRWALIAVAAATAAIGLSVVTARAIVIDIYAARLAAVPAHLPPPAATPTEQTPKQPAERPLARWLRVVVRDNDAATVVGLARNIFDYRELTRRAFSSHWGELSLAEQDEFARLVQAVIERRADWASLPRQVVEVTRADEELNGDEALVVYDLRTASTDV